MIPHAASKDIHAAALVHLSVLDDFIRIVEAKMEGAPSPFVQDSLADLLNSLTEQRDTYGALADDEALAA